MDGGTPLTDYIDFSGWADRPGTAPSAEGDLSCDVLVVGGGYCGMSAALALAGRGADVILAESEFCGWGASSRNAGHLTPTIAGDPQILATIYRRRAPELISLANNAIEFVLSLIAQLHIDCSYEPTGNVSVALTDGGMRRAEKITRFLSGAGAHVELVEADGFGLPRTMRGGILERLGGTLDPGRLAMGLRDRLLRTAGVRIFEQSSVRRLVRRDRMISAETPAARIEAEHALVATNAFSAELPFAPRRAVVPLWVTLAETDPIDPELIAQTGWTSRAGIYTQHIILENYRMTARNTISFGTRRVQRAKPPLSARTPDRAMVAELDRALVERFPSLADVPGASARRTWGGWIAMTPSWLPVAGVTTEGIHYAIGFNGHGVAQAPYVGKLIADCLGGSARDRDLQTIWRAQPRFPPTPLFTRPALELGWRLDRVNDWLAQRGS